MNGLFPMMSDKEITIVNQLIAKYQPKICLEWGSGGSTLFFPNENGCIKKWVSIEHNANYYEKVKQNADKKVDVYLVRLDEYLKKVKDLDLKYDFIFIDGLMRAECLWFAEDYLNTGGFILLHDSGRAEYQDFISRSSFNKDKLIDGEIPITTNGFAHRGLTIFTK